MKIKKFEAANMRDALEKIKAEMGPDAFILGTKSVKKKGPLGFGERTFLQITAAVEDDPLPSLDITQDKEEVPLYKTEEERAAERESSKLSAPSKAGKNGRLSAAEPLNPAAPLGTYDARGQSQFSQGFEAVFQESRVSASAPAAEPTSNRAKQKKKDHEELRHELRELRNMVQSLKTQPQQEPELAPLKRELAELKTLLYNVVRNQGPLPAHISSPILLSFYRKLMESGIMDSLAAKLVQIADQRLKPQEKEDSKTVWRYLRKLIRQTIDVDPPLKLEDGNTKMIALVGPTGVGKTTTLAKLAAYAALNMQSSCVLITLDTYRISAVDQLKNYAKIMEIPIQVALNINELRQAIQFHQDKSLILIDTAGHSQNDDERMQGLRELLGNEPEIDVHLVLSATTKQADLGEIVRKFGVLKPRHLVFTKLDETNSYGALFTQLVKTKLPVSYLTIGQQVPEDIEFANRELLADLFMGYKLDDILRQRG